MKELANVLFGEGKLKTLLCGGDIKFPVAMAPICHISEEYAESITAYARQNLLHFFENGELPVNAVNGFNEYMKKAYSPNVAHDVIEAICKAGIVPERYVRCCLCGEYYDTEEGHDCEFIRFLMGEQPENFHFGENELPHLGRETADLIASHAKEVFDGRGENDDSLFTDTEAFMDWLMELEDWTSEKAFWVIYYLQEKDGLIPDTFELCRGCNRLYDSEEEGTCIDEMTTVMVEDSEYCEEHEVYANFPRSAHGCYCDSCRPDNPLDAFLSRKNQELKLHSHAAIRMDDVKDEICPYGQGTYCARSAGDLWKAPERCNPTNCPLGRQAGPQDLFMDEIMWEALRHEDALDMINEYGDFLIVPAEVFNKRKEKSAVMKYIINRMIQATSYYLLVSRPVGMDESYLTFYTEKEAEEIAMSEICEATKRMQRKGVSYERHAENGRYWITDPSTQKQYDSYEIIPVMVTHKAPENADMKTFCFTFGSDEKFPFQGGWVEVEAPDLPAAQKIFRTAYPDVTPGVLNCADYYEKDTRFLRAFNNGNRGKFCVKSIPFFAERD